MQKKKEKVQKFVLEICVAKKEKVQKESDSILWKGFVQKGKSVVQKSLLDFGTHPLGSVLCKRKRCSVKKEDSKGSSVA